ncbi:hypothetical protein J7426_12445 [Tropicibacter sp. R16_0]|uniref:hypothetical protein n=1 Tax=Tropicibacter sp. R16_0 TaxID=2821102 RepID=UPI001ADAF3C7|nr:hypothetical protein [Tropicibacter sp. R16_0]MBO9451075.1 hypothetical protein [Tropicibacter sp. R16_0]
MDKLQVERLDESGLPSHLFGGNFLFHRDTLGDDGPFEEAADALGFTTVRYPGGSVTEEFFDISNPDNERVYDPKIEDYRDLTPLSEFLDYAHSTNVAVQIVLPTVNYLSEDVDLNGDRFSNVDEEGLSKFVTDVVGGVYGEAEVISFELGNEYWGQDMSSVEYGRVASKMADIVSSTVEALDGDYPGAKDIGIVVQVGTNFGSSSLDDQYDHLRNGSDIIEAIERDYDIELDSDTLHNSGTVDWIHVNEQLLQAEVQEQLDDGSITGVVTHLYSREPAIEGSGENPMKWLDDHWLDDHPDLDVYVSEWNQKGNTQALDKDDYGLYQASEMLDLIETMHEYSTDVAHVWPTIQWSDNALIRGFEFNELAPGGEMFKLMSSQLAGTKPIKFASSEDGEHEALLNDGKVELHGFASEDKMVMFLTSNSSDVEITELDLSNIVNGFESASGTQLGVEEGDSPGNVRSKAELEDLDQDDLFEDTELSAVLGAYEILQVVVDKPDWTAEMREFISGSSDDADDPLTAPSPIDNGSDGGDDGGDGGDGGVVIPTVPSDDEPPPSNDDLVEEIDDDGGLGGLAWLLLLPLAGIAFGLGR